MSIECSWTNEWVSQRVNGWCGCVRGRYCCYLFDLVFMVAHRLLLPSRQKNELFSNRFDLIVYACSCVVNHQQQHHTPTPWQCDHTSCSLTLLTMITLHTRTPFLMVPTDDYSCSSFGLLGSSSVLVLVLRWFGSLSFSAAVRVLLLFGVLCVFFYSRFCALRQW